jgi:hypothetical protein
MLFYLISLLPNSYFFRKTYIIQTQEELIFIEKPYTRFLDKKGLRRKVILRADVSQFVVNGSFGDICAIKGDEKISIISNYHDSEYMKNDYGEEIKGKDGEFVKKIYIGMEEPLAEKICFKLNEFWGFDTTAPIADEQKNELKVDAPFLDDNA